MRNILGVQMTISNQSNLCSMYQIKRGRAYDSPTSEVRDYL